MDSMTYIKFLNLDEDWCITVGEYPTWYAAVNAMKDFRANPTFVHGIYFFDNEG